MVAQWGLYFLSPSLGLHAHRSSHSRSSMPCSLPGSSYLTICQSQRLRSRHDCTVLSSAALLAVLGPGTAARTIVSCWVWPPFPPSWTWEPRAWSPWSQSLMTFHCPQNLTQRLHSWLPHWQMPHCSQFHC